MQIGLFHSSQLNDRERSQIVIQTEVVVDACSPITTVDGCHSGARSQSHLRSPGDKLGFLFLLDRICRTLGHRWTQYFTSGIVYLVAEAYQALDTSHVVMGSAKV